MAKGEGTQEAKMSGFCFSERRTSELGFCVPGNVPKTEVKIRRREGKLLEPRP